MKNQSKATLRGVAACIDDVEADRPRPSQRALYRRLQAAQRRWRVSRGKKRDEAWREMLRISKAMDQGGV
jgi:hypothetical protein